MDEMAAKISDSELEVLSALWDGTGAMTLAQIRQSLEGTHSWDSSTIKTLVRRLCEKGAVEAEKREVYYYCPLLTRREYRAWSTQTLIHRLFQGSARQMVASLVEGDQLSEQDIRELMELLEREGSHE
jgi:BlaI family penicillinase repressor